MRIGQKEQKLQMKIDSKTKERLLKNKGAHVVVKVDDVTQSSQKEENQNPAAIDQEDMMNILEQLSHRGGKEEKDTEVQNNEELFESNQKNEEND